MADTRITITCEEHVENCKTIKVTAERDYKPIFTEAFLSIEKPVGVHLIDREKISGETACKSATATILSDLTGFICNSVKTDGRMFTEKETDMKSEITDIPAIKRFEEIVGMKFDYTKFHNRREFRAYFLKLINE